MKTKIILTAFLCLCALAAQSQTYVKYVITNFPTALGGPYGYEGTISFTIPTNTIATILNAQGCYVGGGDIETEINSVSIQEKGLFPVDLTVGATVDNPFPYLNNPQLGPATVNIVFATDGITNSPTIGSGSVLVEFNTVNTTPSLSGYGVVPNGHTSTIALQSSTDLTTWQSASNGTYPATNTALFYRMALSVN